jgi:hypothetical protein
MGAGGGGGGPPGARSEVRRSLSHGGCPPSSMRAQGRAAGSGTVTRGGRGLRLRREASTVRHVSRDASDPGRPVRAGSLVWRLRSGFSSQRGGRHTANRSAAARTTNAFCPDDAVQGVVELRLTSWTRAVQSIDARSEATPTLTRYSVWTACRRYRSIRRAGRSDPTAQRPCNGVAHGASWRCFALRTPGFRWRRTREACRRRCAPSSRTRSRRPRAAWRAGAASCGSAEAAASGLD